VVTLIQVLIVLAVVAAVAAVAAGVVRGGLPDPASSLPDPGLPPDRLHGSDLADVRFSLGLRGYRMDEVDEVLDRAAAELEARDAELAELRSELAQLNELREHQPHDVHQEG
jgi:DivIVA domain-containing protein